MKLCILGATGNSGRRLVAEAILRGHHVTAIVRDAARAAELEHPQVTIIGVDHASVSQLSDAMKGHDAAINAAGYLSDTENFATLVARIVDAAQAGLGAGGRFWTFGGAALLDVPGTSKLTMDLPGVPTIFQTHRTNYAKLRDSTLDWSILCPGPMIAAPDGKATQGLLVSADTWPVPRPGFTRFLPRIATSLAFRNALGRFTIYYEDAAKVILDNLESNGPFKCKRVGVALPVGMSRYKEQSTLPAELDADRRA